MPGHVILLIYIFVCSLVWILDIRACVTILLLLIMVVKSYMVYPYTVFWGVGMCNFLIYGVCSVWTGPTVDATVAVSMSVHRDQPLPIQLRFALIVIFVYGSHS